MQIQIINGTVYICDEKLDICVENIYIFPL